MITRRVVIGVLMCLVGCGTGYFGRPVIEPALSDMPTATEPTKARVVEPAEPGAVALKVSKIEVVDSVGRLMLILTSENGAPVLIVNDGGKARKVDLAWLAKRVS